jgi:transposase
MDDKDKKEENILTDEERRQYELEIQRLKAENKELKKETEKLKEEIKHLQKPKWAKANKKLSKKSEKNKMGPKKGHSASPRKPVTEVVDQELMWVPELCPEGHGLLVFPKKWHEHLQIDIPETHRFIVTKHVVGWSYCGGCKKYHGAEHEKLSNTKYGPNLHSYAAYLKFDLGMTLGKIQRLVLNQYDLKISTGVLSEMISRCGDKFKSEYQSMKANLKNTSHLHADETGWRNGGNSEWLWSFSNEKVSVYVIEPSRGQKVVESVLGDVYNGILISDFYGAYNRISCRKQKCWTHLLRELHVLKEKHPDDREVLYFSLRLKRFFDRANILKKRYLENEDIESDLKRLETNVITFLSKKFEHKKLNTLIKRMTKYYLELFTFIKSSVPATNNPAEREIRPAVLMRKTSYCNRSEQGKLAQVILMSIIATAKRTNRNFMNYASEKLRNIGI